MWQLTWILSLLPDWFWTVLLVSSIATVLLSRFFLAYKLPMKIVGSICVVLSVWMLGAASNEAKWEARVKDLEVKIAEAEAKSAETNTKIVIKTVKQLELVRTRGDDIIKYVDREVSVDKEVIKFVENCPIPQIIIGTHNAAALNQPIEANK